MSSRPRLSRRRRVLTTAVVVGLLPVSAAFAQPRVTAVPPTRATAPAAPAAATSGPGQFTLVGHDPLFGRGMNAALALYGTHVYVGNRTDGSPGHSHPGVLVVDVKDPSKPKVVSEITEQQGGVSQTSRELRVWPQQKLLMILDFDCSALLHRCASAADAAGSTASGIRFYDLTNPAAPKLISTYTPSRTPHEVNLWLDPARPAGRALLYMSTPTSGTTRPNLIVTDISGARTGVFKEITTFNPNAEFPTAVRDADDVRLHSMTVTPDGRLLHLAYLGGGYLTVDSSEVAAGKASPSLKLLTPVANRTHWGNPGAHSAVPVPGRPNLVLMTDEVYGKFGGVLAEHGCPWGWVRLVDTSNVSQPRVVSEYKLAENQPAFCKTPRGSDPRTENFTSFSSHNPTVVSSDLAFVTWHSKGLQAIDLRDPARPVSAGEFLPEPLASVTTEDPALGGGPDKVIMWSFPVISDGLIYVIDLRNGLYILKYDGPLSGPVKTTGFLEGNSNVGQVLSAALTGAKPAAPAAPTRPVPVGPAPQQLPRTGTPTGLAGLALLVVLAATLLNRRRSPHV